MDTLNSRFKTGDIIKLVDISKDIKNYYIVQNVRCDGLQFFIEAYSVFAEGYGTFPSSSLYNYIIVSEDELIDAIELYNDYYDKKINANEVISLFIDKKD